MRISGRESTRSSERETAEDCLSILVREIHTVIAATVDDDGLPITCAIDMMDSDEDGLYFLTARGKGFHQRLCSQGFIALTGIKGNDTMSSIAVSVRGRVEEAGTSVLRRLLEKNPYMYGIYPTDESRKALVAFRLYEGTGEYFDLSTRPIERRCFGFGGCAAGSEILLITDRCTGCGRCLASCPQQCIDTGTVPFRIRNENCLMCGRCVEVCPREAVIRRKDDDT